MKRLSWSFSAALFLMAVVIRAGGALAAGLPSVAPVVAPMPGLPDLTVSGILGAPPYTMLAACAPGQKAIIFHLYVANIGSGASPPINNVHAVWVQDSSIPAWSGGAAIPAAIPAHGGAAIDVTLDALKPASSMWGPHSFKVTVNGAKTVAEASYVNNTAAIALTIPKGYCTPGGSVSIAANPTLNVAPSPTHAPLVNPNVMLAPGTHITPAALPPPVSLTQAFTKDVCQAHGGTAGSIACYIGLPAGKVALVWDYPYSNPIDGFNLYRTGNGAPAPMTIHMLTAPKPIATQADPSWKFAVIDPPAPGACFGVTAYHGTDESKQSVRFCLGPGGVPQVVSLNPDRVGTMVEDWWYRLDTEVWKQSNTQPFVRDLLSISVGFTHTPNLWRDQAHTEISEYQNSLFRGYAHFNTAALSGHHIAQAQLHLIAGQTQGVSGGQTCLANYGTADRLWNPGDKLHSTSSFGGSRYQGPELRLDVTSIVQGWADSPGSNNGFTLDSDQPEVIYNMIILGNTCLTPFPTATLDVTYN